MFGIGRLILVSVMALIAFMVALVSFHQVPAKECEMSAIHDPSYKVTLVEPPMVNSTVYHVNVTHDGQPVVGATVCMRADMGGAGGMSGMGVSNLGREVGPGRYEVDVMFQMGGYWQGRVVVQEAGHRGVETQLAINVT